MREIQVSPKISYWEATEEPLSADVGIIRENGQVWLFDVGNGENPFLRSKENYHIVLSHFHPDHIGNIGRVPFAELFASRETVKHIHMGTEVREPLDLGNLRIFPIPSSHAKGCLGLEIDQQYAFVGDALYPGSGNGRARYNATLLKDQIDVLRELKAERLLISHQKGMIREKADILAELEAIYRKRNGNDPEITV